MAPGALAASSGTLLAFGVPAGGVNAAETGTAGDVPAGGAAAGGAAGFAATVEVLAAACEVVCTDEDKDDGLA